MFGHSAISPVLGGVECHYIVTTLLKTVISWPFKDKVAVMKWIGSKKFVLKVFLKRTRILSGIQFTMHFIEILVVERNWPVSSFVNVILTRQTCARVAHACGRHLRVPFAPARPALACACFARACACDLPYIWLTFSIAVISPAPS